MLLGIIYNIFIKNGSKVVRDIEIFYEKLYNFYNKEKRGNKFESYRKVFDGKI